MKWFNHTLNSPGPSSLIPLCYMPCLHSVCVNNKIKSMNSQGIHSSDAFILADEPNLCRLISSLMLPFLSVRHVFALPSQCICQCMHTECRMQFKVQITLCDLTLPFQCQIQNKQFKYGCRDCIFLRFSHLRVSNYSIHVIIFVLRT